MGLFQRAPRTAEDLDASRPLAIPPAEVAEMSEDEWYAKAYRGDSVPQLTVRAVAMGALLGFLLAFTNLYVGLKTGWHLGVALTACILSYAIWTFMLRTGVAKTPMSILENNCMQSTASAAGYSTGGTFVSALAALLMLSVTAEKPGGTHLSWQVYAVWTFFLAALGVVLAIPMKRNMINQEKLKFPSGTAAAVTLQSLYSEGEAALRKARVLLYTALSCGFLKILIGLNFLKGKSLLPGHLNVFDWVRLPVPGTVGTGTAARAAKPSDWTLIWDNDPVMIGAGMLVGLRIAVWMTIGGLFLVYGLGAPSIDAVWSSPLADECRQVAEAAAAAGADPAALQARVESVLVDYPVLAGLADQAAAQGWSPEAVSELFSTRAAAETKGAVTAPGKAWKEIGIWFGVPIMVASGLLAFLLQWGTIVRAFKGFGSGGGADTAKSGVEVPSSWFGAGLMFASVGVIWTAHVAFGIDIFAGVVAVGLTFALALVACRATGESDITPTGAMGKIMQLTFGILMPKDTTANLMSAGITAGAAASSADLLNDLKSGYLLGANPRRQFVAQFLGIFSGTIATVAGFYFLVPDVSAMTPITDPVTGVVTQPEFPAPAAQAWKAVAEVFAIGFDNMHPMHRTAIWWGLAVGVLFVMLEKFLPKHKKWLPSATGFGLGLILPFQYPLSMLIGAVIAHVWTKRSEKSAHDYLVPVSAGIIAGISIIGVLCAALNSSVFG